MFDAKEIRGLWFLVQNGIPPEAAWRASDEADRERYRARGGDVDAFLATRSGACATATAG